MIVIHPSAYQVKSYEPWNSGHGVEAADMPSETFVPDMARHRDATYRNNNHGSQPQGHRPWQDSGHNVSTAAVGANLGGLGMTFHLLPDPHHGTPEDLVKIGDYLMKTNQMETDFTPAEQQQVAAARNFSPADEMKKNPAIRDMRDKLWSSIDNDDSKDLDQIEYSERLPDGSIKVYVAIADVDALVPKDSPVDKRATNNTTSIYTTGKVYPMLPPEFSTDMTSLNPNADRLAVVTEMTIAPDGTIKAHDVYRAVVNNHCQMAYNSVAKWLESGKDADMPPAMKAVPGIAEQVRMQDEAASRLRAVRQQNGALQFASQETHANVQDGKVVSIEADDQNRAQKLIEDLMVATSGTDERFLTDRGFSSIRRVVVEPQKWDKIVSLAAQKGYRLPQKADSKALEAFLEAQKAKDPDHFKDLSLDVVKLIGRGQFVLEKPGQPSEGHFALAVDMYAHMTAPNRLDEDLRNQRQLKAALQGLRPDQAPYTDGELAKGAEDATNKEKVAKDIERYVQDASAAEFMQDKVGQQFSGFVSFAGQRGAWVRLEDPQVSVFLPSHDVEKGDRVKVAIHDVNVEQGRITGALAR